MKFGKILSFLVLLCWVTSLRGATETAVSHRMTVASDRVSLLVQDGSVLQLVEELGARTGFEVLAEGVDDSQVTLDFQDLSISEAIRAICRSVGYVEVPDAITGRTARVVLAPRKSAKNRSEARRDSPAPRPDPPSDSEPPPDPEPRPDPADTPRPADGDSTP